MNEQQVWINSALNWLKNTNIINEEQYNLFSKHYNVDKLNFELAKEELTRMYQKDMSFINEKVEILKRQQININIQTEQPEIIELEEKNESLKLEDVTDFVKDGKQYIKMNYNNKKVRIIENNLETSGKEAFKILEEKYKNEQYDTTQLFEKLTEKSIEIKIYDFRDLSNKNIYNDLSLEQKQEINIITSNEKFKNKKVLSCPKEHLYILKQDGLDDILISVEQKNGVYQIRQVEEISYEKNQNNMNLYSNNREQLLNYNNEEVTPLDIYDEQEGMQQEELQQITKSKQKTLGAHPSIGTHFHYEDAGFMNILLFIFLTGISSGIILMIILNFILK